MTPRWPIRFEEPADPRRARLALALRVAGVVLLVTWAVGAVVQFQVTLADKMQAAAEYDRLAAAAQLRPGQRRPEETKGALLRWLPAIDSFWAGQNIYVKPPPPGAIRSGERAADRPRFKLHPNSPPVVILMTPLLLLPKWWAALTFNLLKLGVLSLTVVAAARLACHNRTRISDWVVGLGALMGLRFIVGDIQHANTNVFALGAVVLHLWLFRRGRDFWAGGALALAVVIKLTPALFAAYWIYQRNGRLLAGFLIGLLVLAAVLPAATLGPQRAWQYTATWADSLLVPGAVESAWFPTLVNQSLPGVAARYFLTGRDGNIYWDPDDDMYDVHTEQRGWITLAALPESSARAIVRAGQILIVVLGAWAIGWRYLARDDGRRALHYAVILAAMMLLNQRTWDHHAAVLLPAYVAVWQALGYGRISRRARWVGMAMMIPAFALLLAKSTEPFELAADLMGYSRAVGDHWADIFTAYGPTFLHFVLLFASAVLLTRALRQGDDPYAPQRQRL